MYRVWRFYRVRSDWGMCLCVCACVGMDMPSHCLSRPSHASPDTHLTLSYNTQAQPDFSMSDGSVSEDLLPPPGEPLHNYSRRNAVNREATRLEVVEVGHKHSLHTPRDDAITLTH